MKRDASISLVTLVVLIVSPQLHSFKGQIVIPRSNGHRFSSLRRTRRIGRWQSKFRPWLPAQQGTLCAKDNDDDYDSPDDDTPVIVRGFEQDEISDEAWENIETGEPPKWIVMKEMMGINIFTYILAGFIVAFLTANFLLGPGWLGQAIGMKGAGTFTDVSPSLPDTVDLNDPKFLL